jgi:hypothetical protein
MTYDDDTEYSRYLMNFIEHKKFPHLKLFFYLSNGERAQEYKARAKK